MNNNFSFLFISISVSLIITVNLPWTFSVLLSRYWSTFTIQNRCTTTPRIDYTQRATYNRTCTLLLSPASPVTPVDFQGHRADISTEVSPATPSPLPFLSATLSWVVTATTESGAVRGYVLISLISWCTFAMLNLPPLSYIPFPPADPSCTAPSRLLYAMLYPLQTSYLLTPCLNHLDVHI